MFNFNLDIKSETIAEQITAAGSAAEFFDTLAWEQFGDLHDDPMTTFEPKWIENFVQVSDGPAIDYILKLADGIRLYQKGPHNDVG